MRFYFLGDCRRTLILRSHHVDRDISDDHSSRIPHCSFSERSICEISRTRYHYLDTHPSVDQYRSQSQYRPTHWRYSSIRQLWWIIIICSDDWCWDTPLDLPTYGIQASESIRNITSQKTSDILKKIPSEFGRDFC